MGGSKSIASRFDVGSQKHFKKENERLRKKSLSTSRLEGSVEKDDATLIGRALHCNVPIG